MHMELFIIQGEQVDFSRWAFSSRLSALKELSANFENGTLFMPFARSKVACPGNRALFVHVNARRFNFLCFPRAVSPLLFMVRCKEGAAKAIELLRSLQSFSTSQKGNKTRPDGRANSLMQLDCLEFVYRDVVISEGL